MKKHTWCRLVCLLLLAVMLGGCFGDGADRSGLGSDGGELSGETDHPTGEADDFFTQNGHGFLPQSAEIPAIGTETRKHLYELPYDLPELETQNGSDDELGADLQMFYCGETVHAMYYDGGHRYRVMSATDGSLLTEQTFARAGNGGPLADGGFWIVEYTGLAVDFYTADGTKTKVLPRSPAYDGGRAPTFAAVAPDGKTVLMGFDAERPFILLDIESGGKTRIAHEGRWEEWTFLSAQGATYLFGGSKGGLLSIDTSAKTYQRIDGSEPVCEAYGGLYRLTGIESGVILRGTDGDSTALFGMFFEDEDEVALSVGFGCLATVCDGDIRFYDLRESKLIATCKLGDRFYNPHVTFDKSGAVYINAIFWGKPACYVYDLPSAAKATEDVDTCFYEAETLRELIYSYADEVGDTYGIEIFCGSEGNDFDIGDYVGVAVTDPATVYSSLQTVERVLARYPEGMIRECYSDMHDGMELYLCSTLYGVGDEGLALAGGLTTTVENNCVIIVDVYNGLEATLSHELSHAFDRRIEYVSETTGTDWMELWMSIAPSEDAYLYTYDGYENAVRFTPAGEQSSKNIWFAESYGRTFPTEDRATLMECMIAEKGSHSAELLDYNNLEYKAELYCYILRECFVSCDVDEELYWEQHIGIPDASRFEDLLS